MKANRRTRKHHSAEEMERANATGPREPATPDSAERAARRRQHCRAVPTRGKRDEPVLRLVGGAARRGIAQQYPERDFLKAAGPEVKELRHDAAALKEAVAGLSLESRLLNKLARRWAGQ